MKSDTIDLETYFRRIGYAGQRTATLDTLRAIQFRHCASIPYENLNPLLKWPVRLDLASLQEKLIHGGRGGYCFEQNLLFSQVLKTLGFSVSGLAARVLWDGPEDEIRARGHMVIRTEIEDHVYFVDAGFGGATPTGPVQI